jgi:predicted secreted Zn-dependent protease
MRRLLPTTVLLALAACAHAPPSPPSSPVVTLDPSVRAIAAVDCYVVRGATAAAVRQALDRSGPEGADGHYDAKTSWKVSWRYPFEKSASGCRLGPVEVDVGITYVMPRLEGDVRGPLSRRWRDYLTALQVHEDGHANNGRAAGEAVLEALRALPSRPSCGELDLLARETGLKIVRSFNALDDAYDARTKHGVTQGAVFP